MNQEVVADSPYREVEEFEDVAEGVVTLDSVTGIEIENIIPDDTVENRAVLERVEQRKVNIANEWWNLAADLYEVHEKGLYKLLGFKKIDDYYDAKINTSTRYGYDLYDIHNCFAVKLPNNLADRPDEYDSVISKVKMIGVTKAKEIAKSHINDPEIIVDLVNQTFELNEHGVMKTVTEVKSMINNYRRAVKDEPASVDFDVKEKERKEKFELNKKEIYKFKVPLGHKQAIDNAIALCLSRSDIKDSNDKTKSLAFYRICEEWAIESRASIEGELPDQKIEIKRIKEIYNLDAVIPFATSEKESGYESSIKKIEKIFKSSVILFNPLDKEIGFASEFDRIEKMFGIKIIAFKADDKGFIELTKEDGDELPTADCLYGQPTFNDLISAGDEASVD